MVTNMQRRFFVLLAALAMVLGSALAWHAVPASHTATAIDAVSAVTTGHAFERQAPASRLTAAFDAVADAFEGTALAQPMPSGTVKRSIKIVGLGDSHTNGHINAGSTATADVFAMFGIPSPLDRQWGANAWSKSTAYIVGDLVSTLDGRFYRNTFAGTSASSGNGPSGTASDISDGATGHWTYVSAVTWSPWWRLDGQINSTLGCQDPNTALGVGLASYLSLIPQALRAAYQLGYVDVANLGAGGSASYTWAGEQAYVYVAGLLAPNDGDTVTLDGRVYTFRTVPAVAYDVLIGTATGSILNLSNAVNADPAATTGWFAGTPQHPTVFVPAPTATTYGRFTARTAGAAGNSLVVAASNTVRVTAADSSLVARASTTFFNGSDTSALWANGIARLEMGASFGVPDVVVITLGTNDLSRIGVRGNSFAAHMAILVANIHAKWPKARVIVWRPAAYVGGAASAQAALAAVVVPAVDALVAANPSFVSSVDMFSLGAGQANSALIVGATTPHLTPYGYSVLAQLTAKEIARVLKLSLTARDASRGGIGLTLALLGLVAVRRRRYTAANDNGLGEEKRAA